VVPHDDKAQRKERIIYDTIEVSPPPRNEPVSESESELDAEDDEFGETSDGGGDGDGSESDAHDDDGAMQELTIETDSFVSALSSPKDPNPEIPTRRIRKPKRVPLDPTYISAQDEAAKREAQSHVSYAFKTTMKMWSESAQATMKSSTIRYMRKNGSWRFKRNFKPKHDANGNIVRFKARLVAQEFSQAYGIDYFETYAPVAKLTAYRVIFALAATEQWEIHGMDMITADLLGILDEAIYMVQPEGFARTGIKRNLVRRLLRSLYGLKQAAHVWNQKIHAFLIKDRLHQVSG